MRGTANGSSFLLNIILLTMKNITYGEYLRLKEEDKKEYDFYIKYGDIEEKDYLSDTPIEEREFIVVKELMHNINDVNKLAAELENIKEYSNSRIKNKPFYEVIISFKYIISHIVSLMNVENELLTSKVSGYDYTYQIEQVDFSAFPNYYSQLRLLAQNDITKFETIKHMKYSDCFVELLYLQKESDLQKLIDKENARKK